MATLFVGLFVIFCLSMLIASFIPTEDAGGYLDRFDDDDDDDPDLPGGLAAPAC